MAQLPPRPRHFGAVQIVFALIAATFFALGTVLQQRVAMTASDGAAESPLFMLRLARHPVWLAGIAATLIGFCFHAGALAGGQLVIVQPILAMTMVLALPIGARLSAQTITRRDAIASVVLTVALAAFLVLSDPAKGIRDPSIGSWLIAGGVVVALAAALTVAGVRGSAAAKAALVGLAAGALFGLHGALTKGSVDQFDDGVLGPFEHWALYALIVLGVVSMSVAQVSLQAGDLPPAISAQSIASPLAAVVLGVTVFQESLHESALGATLSVLALAAMLAGIAALAAARETSTRDRKHGREWASDNRDSPGRREPA